MSNRTFKTILLLVGLLFINIEAAQAGLIHKLKSYILHEFTDFQLFYISAAVLSVGFLIYVVATPVVIGTQKSVWLDYYPNNPNFSSYQNKKDLVKRITSMLTGTPKA